VIAKALPTNESLTILKVNAISTTNAISTSINLLAMIINDCFKCLQIGKNALQVPGIYAILDAVRARAGSGNTLQHLGFDGMTITLDVEKTLKEMEESHPSLEIVHGGTGGYQVAKPLLTPIEKLTKYCIDNGVRMMDLFRSFDKEEQNCLSEIGFGDALRVSYWSFYVQCCVCSLVS
jgi:hypothetical protein